MASYESTFISRQDMSKQDVAALTNSLSDIVKQNGGTVVRSEYWGLRGLAYKINKSRKGHYTMLSIDAPAAAVEELNRNMRINEDIIRSLTVRVEGHDDVPSVMMNQNKRDEGHGEPDSIDALA